MSFYAKTKEDEEALELLALRDDLTEWEEGFIESLSAMTYWTEKQRETFEVLWAKYSREPMSR